MAKYIDCPDEAADSANTEHIPVVVYFADETCTMGEDFLQFLLCDTGTSGAALPTKMYTLW